MSFNYGKAPDISSERKQELLLFQKQAEISFKNLKLLNLAFSHRSFANESPTDVDNNERLEFLGDSVLGLIVADWLFTHLPESDEGEFSRIKSVVVSEDSLASIAKRLRVDNFILIGKGEEFSGGRNKKALLADCMEAIFGAYYLDSGFKAVKELIQRLLRPEIKSVLANTHKKDYKTLLQEYAQKRFKNYPRYEVVKRTGPEHDHVFWVKVTVQKRSFGPSQGHNKKEAEQAVAQIAYEQLVGSTTP
ncbi:MAG: ribonuclease III [Sphaerochaetaceae bacterium]|jgi:ribonuclease-3